MVRTNSFDCRFNPLLFSPCPCGQQCCACVVTAQRKHVSTRPRRVQGSRFLSLGGRLVLYHSSLRRLFAVQLRASLVALCGSTQRKIWWFVGEFHARMMSDILKPTNTWTTSKVHLESARKEAGRGQNHISWWWYSTAVAVDCLAGVRF